MKEESRNHHDILNHFAADKLEQAKTCDCEACKRTLAAHNQPEEKKELSAEDVNNLFADRNKAWYAWDKFRVSDRYYPEAVANIFLAGWDANDSLVKTYTKALRSIEKYKDDRSAAWAIGHIKNIASEALSLSHKEDTETVEFAEWTFKNSFRSAKDDDGIKWWKAGGTGLVYTTTELYKLFKDGK